MLPSNFYKNLYFFNYLVYNTREMLQKNNIVTFLLNIYYNCVKCIDILAKKYKIIVYHIEGL